MRLSPERLSAALGLTEGQITLLLKLNDARTAWVSNFAQAEKLCRRGLAFRSTRTVVRREFSDLGGVRVTSEREHKDHEWLITTAGRLLATFIKERQ